MDDVRTALSEGRIDLPRTGEIRAREEACRARLGHVRPVGHWRAETSAAPVVDILLRLKAGDSSCYADWSSS